MRLAVLYHSVHHLNTKAVLDHAKAQLDLELFAVKDWPQGKRFPYEAYDLLVFASGIFAFNYHPALFRFLKAHPLPEAKPFLLLHTAGTLMSSRYERAFLRRSALSKASLQGSFACLGWDSFGPLALIGGIHKDRPNDADKEAATAFLARWARRLA